MAIGKIAAFTVWSNHAKKTFGRNLGLELPDNTEEREDVTKFSESGAYFEDGSFEEFTVVLYATGYDFRFPFLSVDCGISAVDKHVYPLYKHCININRPSMFFIGIPFFAVGFPLFDIQVRFLLQFMSSAKKFPSRDKMLEETHQDEKERKEKGLPKKKMHFLGLERHAKYYQDLASTAEIDCVQPVIPKIFNRVVENIFKNFNTYRFKNYKIIDDENFEEIDIEK